MIPLTSIAGLIIYIALPWLLANWSVRHIKHPAFLIISLALILSCVALVLYGLFFSEPQSIRPRFIIEAALQYLLVPLFLSFPAAVTISTTLGLGCLKVRATKARWFGFFSGLVAIFVLPFAALIAGCGLAGACL